MHVALDIVPMAAGRGGTGSGIWTYTVNLLRQLDACCPSDLELGVFARREQLAELGFSFKRLRCVIVAWPGKGIVSRLLWVHLGLPWHCLRQQVRVLHKLATDTPFWCPARRITTLHDFYYEFLMEHTPRAHVRGYERLEQFYFDWVTRLCFRRSQAIIAVSAAVRDEAARRYPDAAARITVVPHGAPTYPVPARPAAGPEAPFLFIYVAKFMTHKGQLDAIRAFERLGVDHPDLARRARLRFRGFANDRDYDATLRAAVARSPWAAQMEISAYQAAAEVPDIYREAGGALLLSQYEGFGFPVVEAQSLGVPLICSDLPVLHEVAGAAALFVRPDDAAAVAAAMARVMTDAQCAQRLRADGLANVQRFTWASAARATLAVYRQVLAAAGG